MNKILLRPLERHTPHLTSHFQESEAILHRRNPKGLSAYPTLPVSVARPVGFDYVILQLALGLTFEPAVALQRRTPTVVDVTC